MTIDQLAQLRGVYGFCYAASKRLCGVGSEFISHPLLPRPGSAHEVAASDHNSSSAPLSSANDVQPMDESTDDPHGTKRPREKEVKLDYEASANSAKWQRVVEPESMATSNSNSGQVPHAVSRYPQLLEAIKKYKNAKLSAKEAELKASAGTPQGVLAGKAVNVLKHPERELPSFEQLKQHTCSMTGCLGAHLSEDRMKEVRNQFRCSGDDATKWRVMQQLVLGPGLERPVICSAFIKDLTGCSEHYLALHHEDQAASHGSFIPMPPHAGGHVPANKTSQEVEDVFRKDLLLYSTDNPTNSEIRYWCTEKEHDQTSYLKTVNEHLVQQGLHALSESTGRDVLHRVMSQLGVKHIRAASPDVCVCPVRFAPWISSHFAQKCHLGHAEIKAAKAKLALRAYGDASVKESAADLQLICDNASKALNAHMEIVMRQKEMVIQFLELARKDPSILMLHVDAKTK